MHPYVLCLVIAAAVSGGAALFTWRHRHRSTAVPFVVLMLAVAQWSLGYALELGSASPRWMLFWGRTQYLGIVTVPVAWLVVALRHTKKEDWLTRRLEVGFAPGLRLTPMALLTIIPAISLLLIWTNDAHTLIWRSVDLTTSGSILMLDYSYGVWFWVITAYAYSLLLAGTFLVIQSLLRSTGLYHRQAIALLIGVSAPWVGNALYISGLSPFPNLDLTPFGYTLTGLAAVWGLFRQQLLDIMPVAREAIIESMSDGVIVLDRQDRVVDINPAAEDIIGRSASETIGQSATQALSTWPMPIEPLLNEPTVHQPLTERQVFLLEDREQRYIDARISDLRDRQKRLTGRMVILRDVSERTAAENALRRRDRILEAVAQAAEQLLMPAPIDENIRGLLERLGRAGDVSRVYVFENDVTESGTIVSSQRYEWVTSGIEPQIDSPDLQNIPLRDAGYARWEETLSQGNTIQGRVQAFPPSERHLLSAQGILSLVIVPIFVDQTWWGFIGFDDCVNERTWTGTEVDALRAGAGTLGTAIQRKRAEDALRESEERYEDLIDHLGEGIGVTDADERFVLANPAAHRIFGVPPGSLVGHSVLAFVDDQMATLVRQETGLRKAGQESAYDVDIIRPDGQRRTLLVTARPQYNQDGQFAGTFGIFRDITERKQAERMKDEFIAVVSHELRTPLAAVTGFTEMLLSGRPGELTSTQREFLHIIDESSQRLRYLVDDLLDVSRVEAGRLKLNREPLRMEQLVDDIVEAITPLAEEKGLAISVEAPAQLPRVNGDSKRLEQVMSNLLSNAIKFTPQGGHVTIRLERDENDIGVSVTDTGVGIQEDELARLFQRFSRTRGASEGAVQGTGLGLYLSKAIIEGHGGRIGIESHPGTGTIATFTIPAIQTPASE